MGKKKKIKKKEFNIFKILKRFEYYDEIYYDGKITNLIIIILLGVMMGCFVLASILIG